MTSRSNYRHAGVGIAHIFIMIISNTIGYIKLITITSGLFLAKRSALCYLGLKQR